MTVSKVVHSPRLAFPGCHGQDQTNSVQGDELTAARPQRAYHAADEQQCARPCTGRATPQQAAQPRMKAELACSTPAGSNSSQLLFKGGKPARHLSLLCACLMQPRQPPSYLHELTIHLAVTVSEHSRSAWWSTWAYSGTQLQRKITIKTQASMNGPTLIDGFVKRELDGI